MKRLLKPKIWGTIKEMFKTVQARLSIIMLAWLHTFFSKEHTINFETFRKFKAPYL